MSRPYQSRTSTFLVAVLVLAALAAVVPARSAACDVVVVKGTDLKPYQDALRGFEDASACDVRVVPPGDGDLLEKIYLNPPDVVVAIGTTAFKKVKALKGLPIVYIMVISSEIDRAMSPNISGVSMDIAPGTYMATMKEIFPGAKRIGLLYDPRNTQPFVEEAEQAAHRAGVELTAQQVRDPSEIPAAVGDMQGKIDLLWMLPDPTVAADETVDYLLRFSIEHNIPIFTFSKKYVKMGAVASLDMDPYDMGAQASEIANRAARGGRNSVRAYARTARLWINAKVAKKMGLEIGDEILRKAGKGE